MNKMLIAIFDNETVANEGLHAYHARGSKLAQAWALTKEALVG
jgi:hypothetical protein